MSDESQDKYNNEIVNRYGNKTFKKANNIIKTMSQDEWESYQNNLDTLFKNIAKLMRNNNYNSKKVQKLIAKHYKLTSTVTKTTKNSYIELANLYSEHEDFIKFFNNYKKGLSSFMAEAMFCYTESNVK
ncbi:TipAS antibiotic-recognition domain-containing protein [Methanobrevibacter filiformis]|nr:TipAS antibiotic-recognition domain-containing protein [Methanobrevibacter filiformis]